MKKVYVLSGSLFGILLLAYFILALFINIEGELEKYRSVKTEDGSYELTIYRQRTNKYNPLEPISVYYIITNNKGDGLFKEKSELDLWSDLQLPSTKFIFDCQKLSMEFENQSKDILMMNCLPDK